MWVSDGGGRAGCNGGQRFEVLQDLRNCCSPRNKMLMRAATVVQQLSKSCRTCFKFYCMCYFTCDRSFSPAYKAGSLRTPRLPGTKPTY